MVNYADRFTPEQLERLRHSALIGTDLKDWERVADWDETLPAEVDTAFSGDVVNVFRELFEENRPTPPEDLEDEDYFIWIDEAFFKFVYGALNEIFKDDIDADTGEEQRNTIVKFGKNTWLSELTDDYYRPRIHDRSLLGQSRLEIDAEGNAVIIEDPRTKPTTPKDFNVVLFNTIGTGIEQLIKQDVDGAFLISRVDLENFLDITIRKPTKEILDFILSDKEPTTEEEVKTWSVIRRDYKFWVDLLNLKKAGTGQTKDGPFVMLNFSGYNETADAIECDSPFLRHAYADINKDTIKGEIRNNEPIYNIPKVTHNTKGNAYKIRNEATSEIVSEIKRRMALRGIEPDAVKRKYYRSNSKRVRIDITYENLIKKCPTLRDRLLPKQQPDGTIKEVSAQNKKTILNRAIFGEVKLTKKCKRTEEAKEREKYGSLVEAVIRKTTVWYEEYINLSITADLISLKNLKYTGITIIHYGKEPDYISKPALHAPEIENL